MCNFSAITKSLVSNWCSCSERTLSLISYHCVCIYWMWIGIWWCLFPDPSRWNGCEDCRRICRWNQLLTPFCQKALSGRGHKWRTKHCILCRGWNERGVVDAVWKTCSAYLGGSDPQIYMLPFHIVHRICTCLNRTASGLWYCFPLPSWKTQKGMSRSDERECQSVNVPHFSPCLAILSKAWRRPPPTYLVPLVSVICGSSWPPTPLCPHIPLPFLLISNHIFCFYSYHKRKATSRQGACTEGRPSQKYSFPWHTGCLPSCCVPLVAS